MRFLCLSLTSLLLFTNCTCTDPEPKALPKPESLKKTFNDMPGRVGAKIRVLDENLDSWVARLRMLEEAKESIDTTYFILEPDCFGMALMGVLAEKAKEGVKVRAMVDARGGFSFVNGDDGRFFFALKKAGVDVRLYNPLLDQVGKIIMTQDLRAGAASDHDKIIVVDGKEALVGGRNISDDYLSDPRDAKLAYYDMDVLLEGKKAAAQVTNAFEFEWARGGKKDADVGVDGDEDAILTLSLDAMRRWVKGDAFSAAELKERAGRAADDDIIKRDAFALADAVFAAAHPPPPEQVKERVIDVTLDLATNPRLKGAYKKELPPQWAVQAAVVDSTALEGVASHDIFDAELSAFVDAKKSIVIQSPYLVLSEVEVKALADASARGVEITILTNSPRSSDSPPTQGAFLEQWPWLLARVPKARLWVIAEERLMHAKVFVIDHQIGVVGSYNVDPLSRGINSELVVVSWSDKVAGRLEGLVQELIARGAPRTYEYRIAKDEQGRPVLKDGQPVVAFGADDHCDKQTLAAARRVQPFTDLLHPFL